MNKPIWFVAAGMRRSGSTLHYHMAERLLPENAALGWTTWQGFSGLVNGYDYGDARLIKSHVFLPAYSPAAAQLMSESRLRPFYIYRDIRDVVALMKRMAPRIENPIIDLAGELEAVLKNHDRWTAVPGCLISRYEEVVAGSATEIMRLAGFLEQPITRQAAALIAADLAPARQRQRQPRKGYDSQALLWNGHVGSGRVGQWKDDLTAKELGIIYEIAGEWLRERDYR